MIDKTLLLISIDINVIKCDGIFQCSFEEVGTTLIDFLA